MHFSRKTIVNRKSFRVLMLLQWTRDIKNWMYLKTLLTCWIVWILVKKNVLTFRIISWILFKRRRPKSQGTLHVVYSIMTIPCRWCSDHLTNILYPASEQSINKKVEILSTRTRIYSYLLLCIYQLYTLTYPTNSEVANPFNLSRRLGVFSTRSWCISYCWKDLLKYKCNSRFDITP